MIGRALVLKEYILENRKVMSNSATRRKSHELHSPQTMNSSSILGPVFEDEDDCPISA